MPAHPVSRLVRFTLAVGTNGIFDHLGYRRPTAHPVRVIEARRAGCLPRLQPRRADPPAPHVRRRRALPGPAGRSSRRLWLRALWVGAQGDGAARLCDRLRLAAPGARDPSAHCADRDRSTKSRCDRVGRLSHPTGQAVIVALRRAQRPVWAPGVRILGRPPIIRRRSRTSSIVDRAPIAWVRWGGPPVHDQRVSGLRRCGVT